MKARTNEWTILDHFMAAVTVHKMHLLWQRKPRWSEITWWWYNCHKVVTL